MVEDIDFRGRRATLIGLGTRTHVALARYLVACGAVVRISERKPREELAREIALLGDLPVELCCGGHRDADVLDADIVFVSPGVPRDLPILETARRRGIPISSEIELVFARCQAPIIGITGSAGKTTTTALVGEILRAAGYTVHVGGNIGVPLIERVDAIAPTDRVVLELSSFQLEALRQSPWIGAILNVTPNHLDRHPTFEHYAESKFNLLRYQRPTDVAVLGADDPVAAGFAPRCPGRLRWFSAARSVAAGAFRRGDELIARDEEGEAVIARVEMLRLPGPHNILNILAASAVARAAGAPLPAISAAVTSFRGVEHRLELVRELAGVRYVNDSIATTPERTIAALHSFDCPIILLAGGRSKHLPLDAMAETIAARVRVLIAFGEMAEEILAAVRAAPGSAALLTRRAETLEAAVHLAHALARPGEVVLLSPAGTSFDQFRDFAERGQRFKELVWALGETGR